ncbi:hypothetical protein GGI15_004091 [Coemansia interrupta]|uniref:Ankyrin repeat protein n=1 Tax=Coemansia interrupta TaxID=1126814 RepID=A0A9W8H7S5_9FUNG|nr:hypothetical protein GGI15_004091 [Coemansia interrupta]
MLCKQQTFGESNSGEINSCCTSDSDIDAQTAYEYASVATQKKGGRVLGHNRHMGAVDMSQLAVRLQESYDADARRDALPFDIVCGVFVWAQRPALSFVSRAFHLASQMQSVRARFFLVEFGRHRVLDGGVGLPARRPRMVRADLVLLLLALGADARADDQWVVRHACAQGGAWAAVLRRLLADRPAAVTSPQGPLDGWRMLGGPSEGPQPAGGPAVDVHLDGDAAVRVAAAHGHSGLVRMLAAAGADMDAGSGEPLVLAAAAGHEACVQALLSCGASAAADESRALRTAVLGGDARLACVRLLLDRGAHVDAMDQCCVLAAAYRGDGVAQPRAPQQRYLQSAAGSVRRSHVELLRLLLARGADPDARGGRPLMFAATRDLPRAAALLVEYGADVHVGGDAPLRLAAERGALGVVHVLLQAGAEVLAGEGAALSGAARGGHVDVVRAILAAAGGGVLPEHLRSAMVAAARGGWRGVVEALLEAGADRDDPEFVACAAKSRDLRRALGLPPPAIPNNP